jgi:hypothetical protein
MRFEGAFRQSAPFVAGAILAATGIGFGIREHKRAGDLAASQQSMVSSVADLRKQVQDLTERANRPPTAVVEPRRPVVQAKAVQAKVSRPAPQPRRNPDDPRWKQMEGQLADQDRKIRETRQELEGRLSSTKDELNGSIAKTHEELVSLQKRGEREYREFTLPKSKQFQKVGPVSLSLRKADTKRKRYDLEMVVDDIKLQKKSVNLFEPVYVTLADRPQPVELVVNQIGKDQIRGYVSTSKYKKSDLVAADSTRTKLEPADPVKP